MATEARTTKALTGPRQLKLMVPEYLGTYSGGEFPGYKTWFPVTNAICFEGKIDVNLSLDDLTMFPQAAILQDPGIYYRTASPIPEDPANDLIVLDVIAVKQLNLTNVISELTALNNAPGMMETTDDFNQIIMGTFRHMGQNTQLATPSSIQTLIDAKDFSSASPFAQDSLWCYRILIPRATDLSATYLSCPASRFLIEVIVGQEENLPYLMRLKNSYELQQL